MGSPQDRRSVLGDGAAEGKGDSCPPDGDVSGAVVVHLLTQGRVERERIRGDAHLPGREILDRFFQPQGGAEAQSAAGIRWPGKGIVRSMNARGSEDPP